MSDMKCLFCGQELKTIDIIHEYHCGNENCVAYQISSDYSQVWNLINGLKIELDRTRKALDVAIESLEMIKHNELTCWNTNYKTPLEIAEKALKQINNKEEK